MLSGMNISRKGLLALMVGGAAANVAFQRSVLPPTYRKSNQLTYVRTKGGWPLAVSQDDKGRLYMFDAAGNFFYDTGDERLGWNMIDYEGNVFNYYVPQGDSQQRVRKKLLGRMDDMLSVPVTEIGGVPVEKIQKQLRVRGNEIMGFANTDPVEYPPEAPLIPRPTGQIDPETGAEIVELMPAPFLEEGAVQLERQGGGGLSWLLGGSQKPPSLLEQMRSLRRGN